MDINQRIYEGLNEMVEHESNNFGTDYAQFTLNDIPFVKNILDLFKRQKGCIEKCRLLGYSEEQTLEELKKL